MRRLLRKAVELGALRAVDLQLARRLEILAGGDAPELLLAAALVSHRVGEGDVCLDLGSCAELPLFRTEGLAGGTRPPHPRGWADALRKCNCLCDPRPPPVSRKRPLPSIGCSAFIQAAPIPAMARATRFTWTSWSSTRHPWWICR
jgi:hypothetical protein